MEDLIGAIVAHLKLLGRDELKLIYQLIRKLVRK